MKVGSVIDSISEIIYRKCWKLIEIKIGDEKGGGVEWVDGKKLEMKGSLSGEI